jgi:hypothetical protein
MPFLRKKVSHGSPHFVDEACAGLPLHEFATEKNPQVARVSWLKLLCAF